MNIFSLHKAILADYESYIKSFIHIQDEVIKEEVNKALDAGKLWPEPLIQFNPSYEKGKAVQELIDNKLLHGNLRHTFKGYQLYQHQVEAIELGVKDTDFIVTSGTGSGKSLTFLGTIFNHIFSLGKNKKPGIKAIIVYPMNALINSQYQEITGYEESYKNNNPNQAFPITYEKYTGQEGEDLREKVRKDPPDIILTNYMMLELILTRLREASLRESIYENLKYLAFDELHTYRGRQGADVALLIRRIRAQCQKEVLCIGTSATMVSGDSILEQQKEVAKVGQLMFGKPFQPHQIIMEYLEQSFPGKLPSADVLSNALQKGIPQNGGEKALKNHPLLRWIEQEIAIKFVESRWVRRQPISFSKISEALQSYTQLPKEICEKGLEHLLLWMDTINVAIAKERPRRSYLPFKLHQFISQSGTLYMTLDQGEEREISLEPQVFADKNRKPYYPIVFSRVSGYTFICVTKNEETGVMEPREFREFAEAHNPHQERGYLILKQDLWHPDTDLEYLPDSWVKTRKDGTKSIEKKYKGRIPQKVYLDSFGYFSTQATQHKPISGWFMTAPLLFDPTARIVYDAKTNDRTKLTELGNEGRSTSTSTLTLAILQAMAKNGVNISEQKVMSFTDNRQDAALQAGHFNDLIRTLELRSAVYHAVKNSPHAYLTYEELPQAMLEGLNLPLSAFSQISLEEESEVSFSRKRELENTLKDYLMYRALYDLRRGWRIILPNLEQCALIQIGYKNLPELCEQEALWKEVRLLQSLQPTERERVLHQILDYFRKEYAIHSQEYLTTRAIEVKSKNIQQRLEAPWTFDEEERIIYPNYLRLGVLDSKENRRINTKSAGPQSALGKFIKDTLKEFEINHFSYEEVIEDIFRKLRLEGFLVDASAIDKQGKNVEVYQLNIDKIIWNLGTENSVQRDSIKIRNMGGYQDAFEEAPPNIFFQKLYKHDFQAQKRFQAAEHTGQINNEKRKEREDKFREGKELSALYCSPTMELGIDIASLNMVHMRNVPPNAANYAQRSGRAGRSGQAALVFTYCSSYSPHDRHYFDHKTEMVAGQVLPPRIDLCNEELIRSHLHALFVAEAGLNQLNESISNLLNMEDRRKFPLLEEVAEMLRLCLRNASRLEEQFQGVVSDFLPALQRQAWFTSDWISRTLKATPSSFDHALDRWRKLYGNAYAQLEDAQEIIRSGLYRQNQPEMKDAWKRQKNADKQRTILENQNRFSLSEFYPFRYLASEGFLPGYNFTRLPIRTYIEVSRMGGDYISRPRFIALREFGPRNIIYHNGSKYAIKQMAVQDAENQLKKARYGQNSGYFLMGEQYESDCCPFDGGPVSEKQEVLTHLLEMDQTYTQSRERINCEEEERMSEGFEIDTYFYVPQGLQSLQTTKILSGEDHILNLRFIPTAKLVQVNKGWRRAEEKGFLMGMKTGTWKRKADLDKSKPDTEPISRVKLFTEDTADALYIEPVHTLNLEREGVLTLMYALKRAIEQYFQVESREIGVSLMGREDRPNIFIYEAAEGSLGILSQFAQDPENKAFKEVVKEAYNLCRYEDEVYQAPASYKDLLSYFNQRYHREIDRFLIKDALEKLLACRFERQGPGLHARNYDEQFQYILSQIDPNSSTERRFLEYIYINGLRLPDEAQKRVEGIYAQPDFFYKPDIHVFCDGTPHDSPEQQAKDRKIRDAIWDRGEQVVVYHYRDSLEEVVAKRPDIFIKMK